VDKDIITSPAPPAGPATSLTGLTNKFQPISTDFNVGIKWAKPEAVLAKSFDEAFSFSPEKNQIVT